MRPTFVLSLDKELIWGSFDHTSERDFAAANPDPRGVVRDLLGLLEEHEVAATWAVVGHLFLRACERGPDGRAHGHLARPRFAWHARDWFADDPCTDRSRNPLWYGDDIVEMLAGARVPQEIGCHSFSHVVYGDPGCDEQVVRDDLGECVRLARARGLSLRSFVFPRNIEGHHAQLKLHGFAAYRGEDPTWYRALGGPLKRGAHLFDQATALTPPVSLPQERLPGLWNIPGSMMLLHRGGVRRLVPIAARVAKARAGLARAVREGKVFHLWFHPFNLERDRTLMMDAMRAILREAVALRDRGVLDVRTMGGLAAEMARAG